MSEETQNPVVVLEMAQRVHDELIAQAKADSERIVQEAKDEAAKIVDTAETNAGQTMADATEEYMELKGKIERMRRFESHYRQRLDQLVESARRTLEVDQGDLEDLVSDEGFAKDE